MDKLPDKGQCWNCRHHTGNIEYQTHWCELFLDSHDQCCCEDNPDWTPAARCKDYKPWSEVESCPGPQNQNQEHRSGKTGALRGGVTY